MDFSPPGSSVHGDFPGQNIGVGSLSLLQGIFPFSQPRAGTQVSHVAGDSLPSEHRGSPRTLERVAYPFSRGSSPPRNQTRLSCIAGRFWGLGFLHAKLGLSEISYYNEKDLVFFNFSEHFIKKNKISHVMSIVQWIHVYYFPSFTIIKIIINISSCLLLPLCLWTIWELVQVHEFKYIFKYWIRYLPYSACLSSEQGILSITTVHW